MATKPSPAIAHPTLDVLRRRRGENSKPGRRNTGDSHRVGLVVDGGGMRGVISGAMLSAIEDLGYKDAFDVAYGCSAGAVNAAYFIAGDTWYPLSIYYDHLASPEFVNFARPLRRMPIMNMKYAFDIIVDEVKPLDYAAVQRSALPLVIAISMVDTQEPELVRTFNSSRDLKEALIATCWLPFAAKGTATFRGRPALDGGVLMPSMLGAAVADGCSHILSLHTRSWASLTGGNKVLRRLTQLYLDHLRPNLGAAYRRNWTHVGCQLRDEMRERVLQVEPLPEHPTVARHEINPTKILRAARDAYASMYALLEDIPRSELLAGRIEVVPRLTVRLNSSWRVGEVSA